MQEKETISLEVENLLKKGAVEQVRSQKDQFLSNIFIVKKKDGGSRSVISLNELNQYIPLLHFKIESLQSLKTLLQKSEYMCKLDLKDAYLCVPHSQDDRKSVMFRWEGTMYQGLCLCFGLALASIVFTKFLKILMALFRRIRIRIVIYLDDMLIIGRTKEETITLRDIVILLFQCLGFVINQKKSLMTPGQEIEFLGMIVNSNQ